MSLITYSKLRTYVQDRLDLKGETFITTSELLGYSEEALKYCEAEVHKLNIEDQYFQAEAALALDQTKKSYDLPSNIYGNKILRITYNRDDRIYDIPRIRHSDRFIDSANTDRYGVDDYYRYRIFNNTANGGRSIRLYPIPQENSTTTAFTADTVLDSRDITNLSTTPGIHDFITGTGIAAGTRLESVTGTSGVLSQAATATGATVALTATEDKVIVTFIRRVEIPTTDTDLIDFPEFWNFIAQHMVVACLKKELGNPRLEVELAYLNELKMQMHSTLSDMVPDQDDLLELDMEHYRDMNQNWRF